MTPLTVACVFVRGEYPYTPEYVRHLFAGVRRHLARPFRAVCLTDQPETMPADVEAIRIDAYQGVHTFWTKLELFNPAHGLEGRILYLDLDTLIVGDLDRIVDFPASLAFAADELAQTFDGPIPQLTKGGKVWRPRFQTSVMVWYGGLHRDLLNAWRTADADRLYTDQDWIAERYPGASVMPVAWFPRLSLSVHDDQLQLGQDAKVLFTKKPKNHLAAERWPWFAEMWRAS
jgi:hypothetical protein